LALLEKDKPCVRGTNCKNKKCGWTHASGESGHAPTKAETDKICCADRDQRQSHKGSKSGIKMYNFCKKLGHNFGCTENEQCLWQYWCNDTNRCVAKKNEFEECTINYQCKHNECHWTDTVQRCCRSRKREPGSTPRRRGIVRDFLCQNTPEDKECEFHWQCLWDLRCHGKRCVTRLDEWNTCGPNWGLTGEDRECKNNDCGWKFVTQQCCGRGSQWHGGSKYCIDFPEGDDCIESIQCRKNPIDWDRTDTACWGKKCTWAPRRRRTTTNGRVTWSTAALNYGGWR
jgi:hypothetical protein